MILNYLLAYIIFGLAYLIFIFVVLIENWIWQNTSFPEWYIRTRIGKKDYKKGLKNALINAGYPDIDVDIIYDEYIKDNTVTLKRLIAEGKI